MPISWYTPRNRRKKRAGVPPLDPVAEAALNAASGNTAIKKQRTSVTTQTEVLCVGSSTKEKLNGGHRFA